MPTEFPAFIKQALCTQYGAQEQRITDGLRAHRVTSARVNTIKADSAAVCSELARNGITVEQSVLGKKTLILPDEDAHRMAQTAPYQNGEIYLQSLSSMLPVTFLGACEGENILDMAAAPGSKTTQIAAMTENKAFITACEKNKLRAQRLRYNIEKQGARGVSVLVQDARNLDPLFFFDRILLDAPCSGSGTVDLSADCPPRITQEFLDRTVKTQKQLLAAAITHLRPGHEMIYSTCSVLAQENEQVVRTVLKTGKAELIPLTAPAGVPLLPTDLPGTLCVCPDAYFEGFFVAKLRKK